MGAQPQNILIVQTAFLGDVVLTTPLLIAVRRAFPSARIAVVAIPATREVLAAHPAVDEIIPFDKKGAQRGLGALIRFGRALAKRRFDLAITPHRSMRSALFLSIAGIPRRIGFARYPAAFFYTDRVAWDSKRHDVERNLALLAPLGVAPSERLPLSLATNSEWEGEVDRLLTDRGIRTGETLVALSPGSVWATKRWLPEGFAAVADALAEKEGLRVLIVGSKADRPVADAVIARCRTRPTDLVGATSLGGLAALSARCRAFITNDNGSMHVAVAGGAPVVAIFGSTTLSLGYGPYTDRAIVVERDLDCRPCGLHGHERCPLGHFRCMGEIRPEDVLAAVRRVLGSG